MGPRHRCRGMSPFWTARLPVPVLQWGRGIAAAEFARSGPGRPLSRSFNGAAASLPRNARLECRPVGAARASMGPRHRCRGMQTVPGLPVSTPRLQWGRGIAAAESSAGAGRSRCTKRFNGAAASLPRNCGPRYSSRGENRRFNGAAASLPRNSISPGETGPQGGASMGPRHRCRGILARSTAASTRSRASMGPRHRCRGISIVHEIAIFPELLQWGRGIAAAEYGQGVGVGLGLVAASMGPRHRCRGISSTTTSTTTPTQLQWGRGIAAAELCCRSRNLQ